MQTRTYVPLKSGTVPVPLFIVDHLMRELSPSAFKVLCVIIRQTLGWQSPDGKGRKPREWISHGWFTRVTGLSGQTVSNAVDELVRSGTVEVTDLLGRPMSTKLARRSSRSRLYFGLNRRLLAEIQAANPWLAFEPFPVTRLQGVERIKQIKKKNLDKANTQGAGDFGVGDAPSFVPQPSGGWVRAGTIADSSNRDGSGSPKEPAT